MEIKFRPTKVEELFGQQHLHDLIKKWLANPETIPQSLLIHGPYGTGKTSIARILAESLVSNPGDINEMNAAASRGIDDVRAIAEDTAFHALGKAKVYIIDELHQMTPAAQQALLKVIEEPKPGTYFILCTTDYEKLVPMIRSRCSKIQVHSLGEPDAMALIDHVGGKDLAPNIKYDIFLASDGHARDIVKMVGMAQVQPRTVSAIATNIRNAQEMLAGWLSGQVNDATPLLQIDDQGAKLLADSVCDNPLLYLSLYNQHAFTIYSALLKARADGTLYLISHKQRLQQILMLRYEIGLYNKPV